MIYMKSIKYSKLYKLAIEYVSGDNLFRRIIKKKIGMTSSEIIHEIAQNAPSIVSFDMFDTLVKRCVSKPQEVFKILEYDFSKKFNTSINFFLLRCEAERRAIDKNNSFFVNISQIYDSITELSQDMRSWCIKREAEIEAMLCVKNPEIFKVFQWCKEKRIKIVIISDMYLPSNVLGNILKNAGYYGWQSIYVSNEWHSDKVHGDLFKHVLTNERIG